MKLTKEQIDDLMRLRVLTKAEAAEIRRLALLGLERDERDSPTTNAPVDVVSAFEALWDRIPEDSYVQGLAQKVARWLGGSGDVPSRAERIGRAVLDAVMAGDAGRLGTPSQTLDEMADEVDAAAYWLTTPGEVLRSIADALREEAGRG